MSKIIVFVVALVVLGACLTVVVHGDTFEIDIEGQVDWVKDGDSFNLTSGEEIRFADIDAPEWYETGGYAAKSYLINLFASYGKHVFLDVDDISRNDSWGRLICVVFVSHNETHYLNVNKQMLEAGHAQIDNYTNNEFNPYTWILLVRKSSVIPELRLFLVLPLFTITSLAILVYRRKQASTD